MSDSLVFEGGAGKTYEFLALATDVAGNREVPKPGVNAVSDGADVNLGATPTVPGTTPPNFGQAPAPSPTPRSEEHTSELQSLMRISYAVFCLKKKNQKKHKPIATTKTQNLKHDTTKHETSPN